MRFVHDVIFPVVSHLSRYTNHVVKAHVEHVFTTWFKLTWEIRVEKRFNHVIHRRDDRDLFNAANYLHQNGFSPDQLDLPEAYCVPMQAAVVELASLDFKSTPLDRHDKS